MKRLSFILLFTLLCFILPAQTDIFWNSLLPNGMDFSRSTADMPYSYTNLSALSPYPDIVATAYLKDTLFATDGQYLYVVYNDSLIEVYNLNRVKAGKDQAFLLTMFYGQSKRQLKIITSVDDTLKLFTWPDLSNYKILETGIEPVIYVSSFLENDTYYPDSLFNSAHIVYIGKNYVPSLLKVYTLDFSSGTLQESDTDFSMFVQYNPPVSMVRYYNWYIFIKDKDSVRVWLKDVNNDYNFHQVSAFPPTVKDIVYIGYKLFMLTDTAIVLIRNYDYYMNEVSYDERFIHLGNTWHLKQFVPTPYGQLLILPDTSAVIETLYNIIQEHYYFEQVIQDYVSNPQPKPINIVGEYNPVFYSVNSFWTNPFTYCQTIPKNIYISFASMPTYLYYYSLDVPPENSFPLSVSDTVFLDSLYPSGLRTNYFSHSEQNYFIIKSFVRGIPVEFRYYYDDYDSSYTIYAGKEYNELFNSNIHWLFEDILLSDTTSSIKVKFPGIYTLKIENPHNGCVYDTSLAVIAPQYFIGDLVKTCYYKIDNTQVEFIGVNTAFVTGDSLKIDFVPTTETYDSMLNIPKYRYLFFWDGKFIGTDTSFVVKSHYSGMHHLDFIAKKKDSTSYVSLIDFHTEFPVISPKLKRILGKRRYAIGDTARFVISSDTVNSDISINDEYTDANKIFFKQVNDSTWIADVLDTLAMNSLLTAPDSLRIIFWIATNKADKLIFTLIAPDGKQTVFYSGFNGYDDYYFIGQPYCKAYNTYSFDKSQIVDLDLYPIVFSGLANEFLGTMNFEKSYYSDCVVKKENVPILKEGNNVFRADFSSLAGSPLYGTWKLIVHKNADSVFFFGKPILDLPPQKVSFHFLKDTANNIIRFRVKSWSNNTLMDKLDNTTYVMKEKGKDSIIFSLSFYLFDRPVNLDYYNQEDIEKLTSIKTNFFINIERRNIYYDNQTYSFSPNGDGINDYWNPLQTIGNTFPVLKKAPPEALLIKIVNDKGLVVRSFTMAEQPLGWDGLDQNGKPVPHGIYWYIVFYRDQKYYGTILLLQ